MLNYERIVDVITEELGPGGADTVSNAIGIYLKNAGSNIGCLEDLGLLWPLFYCFDLKGHNYLLTELDPLCSGMDGVSVNMGG